ncbi:MULTISPECIES: 1-phosphofructokinase family hexose kinase [Paenibacillus]|uniref:1-phosphofructokinase family hexose kinase n=1 Tax=Paenibacillus TaxID=44249 RepID=UPI0009EACF41|nr:MULTISPECIES: 1-phosphofructokinase family hexose kinase [Paenibacillus]MDU4696480.1 1-phosphofructokinase family hexose kinase [Paenibacillus sp.]
MITTVTLHAAIDRTCYVDRLHVGQVHRIARQFDEPGGKGNNVAKVIRQLGGEVTATGMIAGSNGAFIEHCLNERGIHTAFVKMPGESRVCLNIVDEARGSSTELLGQGPAITKVEAEAIREQVGELSGKSSVVVLSGSLPAGAEVNLYADLIGMIRSSGAKVFLDTSSAALREGITALPHFVKPNEQELAQWLGHEPKERNEWIQGARQLADQGISAVCVTLGSRGAIAVLEGAAYFVRPPRIQPVNTVGCGDAFVAGMAYAEECGKSPADKLRIAAAAAAANAMSIKAGDIDIGLYQEYERQVEVIAL